jgi:hypothetical protein
MFKLISRMGEVRLFTKRAIGMTPVLLESKLTHQYYSSDEYVDASIAARSVKSMTKEVVIDMVFVLHEQQEVELPEHVLSCVCLIRVDYLVATPI